MRAWIGALVVGLSLGCSSGAATNDGGAGSGGGTVGGRGGQAGGAGGQAGGASGQGGTAGTGGSAGTGAGGRGGRGGGGASGGGGSTDGGVSGCAMLNGLSFDSVDERECGLAPPDSGLALCHWRISFASTTFTWRHSDVIETGSYTCSGNTITAQMSGGIFHTATLDPTLWRINWYAVVYACTNCPP